MIFTPQVQRVDSPAETFIHPHWGAASLLCPVRQRFPDQFRPETSQKDSSSPGEGGAGRPERPGRHHRHLRRPARPEPGVQRLDREQPEQRGEGPGRHLHCLHQPNLIKSSILPVRAHAGPRPGGRHHRLHQLHQPEYSALHQQPPQSGPEAAVVARCG